jgi:hypothetical protein
MLNYPHWKKLFIKSELVAFTRLGWQIKSALLEIEAARIDWDSQKVKESIG